MKAQALRDAGRHPPVPLKLELAGEAGVGLVIERWLRILPGRRYVGVARWGDREVLAKLFVGARAARRMVREQAGVNALTAQALDTPRVLAAGHADGVAWLLFDYLACARSLSERWKGLETEPMLSPAQRATLEQALSVVGRLHQAGLWQSDLHLANLLDDGQGRVYLIDGDGIQAEQAGRPLSAVRAADNLGVFFAQFPAQIEPYIPDLLKGYRVAAPGCAVVLDELIAAQRRVRAWRQRDLLRKAGRDCTLFSVERGLFGLRAVWREALPGVGALLEDPDQAIARGHRYKDGGAATVAKVEHEGRTFILKRYNIKHALHALKRFWRPSRAWHSWIEGHRLRFCGIATPQPLAVLERRWCGLRGRAYLITDYVDGQDILSAFAPYVDSPPPVAMLEALDRLFAALIRERISHGDLKGTNLFWQAQAQGGQWVLIDLDAVRQHHCSQSFARAFRRDRARFLRNWPADSMLYQLLNQRIPNSSFTPNA